MTRVMTAARETTTRVAGTATRMVVTRATSAAVPSKAGRAMAAEKG
jgi:hypothetical protein